jgi:hypothetical protein
MRQAEERVGKIGGGNQLDRVDLFLLGGSLRLSEKWALSHGSISKYRAALVTMKS